jgi:glycerol transport system ATP-binding protein
VHVDTSAGELVAQLTGVHFFALGAPVTLHLNPLQVYVFDAGGALLVAPPRRA